MTLPRSVPLLQALRYRGGEPFWAWIVHRISGLGMILFVGTHVLAGLGTTQLGSDWALAYNAIYESLPFQLFIYFCVIFHVVNGARIIVLDFWPALLKFEREAVWLVWAIVLPIYALAAWTMITGG